MLLLGGLLLGVALCGCQSDSRGRVIVLGIDGLDPGVVDLLMAEGEMPNFARLRRGGAYARLQSSEPILSPIIWTTIATGRVPADHEIGHFVAINEATGERLPVTSQMRAVKALWNIFSERDRSVGVVGWWATWPAETVRGAIVSDHTCYHFLFDDGAQGGDDSTGVTYPPGLRAEIEPMIRRPADVGAEELEPFARVEAAELERPFSFDDDLAHFRWAYSAAETYRAIGKYLWRSVQPDLLMVYIEGTDSASHLFGHLFRATDLAGELAEQRSRFGDTVEEMYRYADRLVGEYIEIMDDDTTLIVLSDHGFELGALPQDPSKTRDMRRVSEKHHKIEGILYAYGRNVRARRRFDRPTLVDVAPTVLALAGLSPSREMPGRVLYEGLSLAHEPRSVASYESGGVGAAGGVADRSVDPAILERLRALGYLDTESPSGDRNLAALLFEEQRFEEAVAAYEKLVAASPRDGALRASLAAALGSIGRLEDARDQADQAIRLAPLNPGGYHNRAVLHEKAGERDRAVADYREALRYAPDYAPSRQALERMGAGPDGDPVRDAQEIRAAQLAEAASLAARRGDYGEAMSLLDRAEAEAPRLALVHQYRSNVAFLMGDIEAARAALRKALEIEPDNVLYKTNLERLASTPSGK